MSITLPPLGTHPKTDAVTPAMPPSVGAKPAAVNLASLESSQPKTAKPDATAQLKSMRKELEQALTEANRRMQLNGRALAFSLDEKADRMVIKVTNSVTGELVRQIPDETVLRIAHSLDDLKGFLYDQAG